LLVIGLYSLDEARQLLKRTLYNRIRAAVHAAQTGTLILCDAGHPTPVDQR
jgi:hypothetical protein